MKNLLFISLVILIGCNPNSNKQIQDVICTAYDGSVYRTIQEKDEHNQYLIQMRHLENEHKVRMDSMSEYEEKLDNLDYETVVRIKDVGLYQMSIALERGDTYEETKQHLDSIVNATLINFPIK